MKSMALIRRLALAALLAVSPAALVACGNSNGGEQVATDHVGPIGPTSPNGYYFDLTVTPHTITSGNNIAARVRVWDENGNTASGVPVALLGASGSSTDSQAVTGTDGWAGWIISMAAVADSYAYVTVVIEDKSLTAPVHIIPGTITAFSGSNG